LRQLVSGRAEIFAQRFNAHRSLPPGGRAHAFAWQPRDVGV